MTDTCVNTAAILRAAAAGRREYAGPECDDNNVNVRLDEMRDALMAEAGTLELAARVAEGDYRPLYGWLPSWRWTAEMDRLVLASAGDSISAADVAALATDAPSEHDAPAAADRVETAARVLHARRHRAGYSHCCDACRGDARAVAAALTGDGRAANAAALLDRCDEVEADTMGRHGHGGHVLPAVLSTSVIRALLSTGEAS